MELTVIVRKKSQVPEDVDTCEFLTQETQTSSGTIIVHDASLIPQSMVENVDHIIMYNQTSAKSLKFLYENFFHIIYDQPATFKSKVKECLSGQPEAHFKLNVNTATLSIQGYTSPNTNNSTYNNPQQVMNMVDVMAKLFMPSRRDILD